MMGNVVNKGWLFMMIYLFGYRYWSHAKASLTLATKCEGAKGSWWWLAMPIESPMARSPRSSGTTTMHPCAPETASCWFPPANNGSLHRTTACSRGSQESWLFLVGVLRRNEMFISIEPQLWILNHQEVVLKIDGAVFDNKDPPWSIVNYDHPVIHHPLIHQTLLTTINDEYQPLLAIINRYH